jgi:uncharacterized repeat protein (TIGR01451 family)
MILRYWKRHRIQLVIIALVLAASTAVSIFALQMAPTQADLLAAGAGDPDDPIIYKPGIPVDAAAVNWDIRRYQKYNDTVWSGLQVGSNTHATNGPLGIHARATSNTSDYAYYPWGNVYGGTSSMYNRPVPLVVDTNKGIQESNTGNINPTRDHALFFPKTDTTPSIVRFAGYYGPAWFDYVYTEQLDIQSMEFDIIPSQWALHTLHRTGFFFKCKRTPTPVNPVDSGGGSYTYDSSNGTISGYMLSIGDIQNTALYQSGIITGNFEMYYVQGMNIDAWNNYITSQMATGWNTQTYPNGSIAAVTTSASYSTVNTTLMNSTYCNGMNATTGLALPKGSGNFRKLTRSTPGVTIPNLSGNEGKLHIRLESDETSFRVYLTDEEGNKNTGAKINGGAEFLLFEDAFATKDPSTGVVTPTYTTGDGFGLYMQNNGHACARLTVTDYQDFSVQLNNAPQPVHPTVKYYNMNDNSPIHTDFLFPSDMWGGVDFYDIDPPDSITYGGKEYRYYKADRAALEDIPVELADEDADHITTLYYVEAPTIRKDARILTSPISGIHNGSASKPWVFLNTNHIQYTITVTNPNIVALDSLFVVQDSIPVGLSYVSHTQAPPGTPNGVKDVFSGQDRVTWTLPAGLPAKVAGVAGSGVLTFTIEAEVNYPRKVLENWAVLIPEAGNGLETTQSNHTFHKSTPIPVEAFKDAQVQPGGAGPFNPIDNGSSSSRVTFNRGDRIKYTITADNANAPIEPNQYDLVYAVDWSGSVGTTGRNVARVVSEELADLIINEYPGSRIGFQGQNFADTNMDPSLGVGLNGNLTGSPLNLYLQADTPFVDTYADYLNDCANAYSLIPYYINDDCPVFFRAAFEKLYGPVPGNVGFDPAATVSKDASGLTIWGAPLMPGGAYPPANQTVQVRADKSRIPLIVLASDWQLMDDVSWQRMIDIVKQFHAICPAGIFIPVYINGFWTPPSISPPVATKTAAEWMQEMVDIGEGDWGWADIVGLSSSVAADNIMNIIRQLAPLVTSTGSVKDILPPGMEIVSVNPSTPAPDATPKITYDSVTDQYTVEWEFEDFPDGVTQYEIICEVKSGELTSEIFDNQAIVSTEFQSDEEDWTYHELPQFNVKTTWQEFRTSPAATGAPLGKADRTETVIMGNQYQLQTGDLNSLTPGGKTFTYYAYSLDGGATYTTGVPPDPVLTNITSNREIILYFRTTHTIVEKFHSDASPYTTVNPDAVARTFNSGDSWTPSSTTTTIPALRYLSGVPYNLIPNVYKLDADTAAQTPWGVAIGNIQADHVVIYPYSAGVYQEAEITETFRKFVDPTQQVNAATAPDIVTSLPFGDDFDVPNTRPTASIDNFTYVGYSVDGGAITYGDPPPHPPQHLLSSVAADHTITYFYAELASKTAQVYHGGTGTPDPEATGTLMSPILARPGDDILYIVKLAIPAGVAQSGTVIVTDVLPKGLTAINADVSHGGTVSYNSVTDLYTVTWSIPLPTTPAPSGTLNLTVRSHVVTRSSSGYVNEAKVKLNNAFDLPEYTTNYTVHSHVRPGSKMLHVRQIILARNPALSYAELPAVGYFTASNNGHGTSFLSTSGLWGFGVTPFTIYTFPPSADPEYYINNLVPSFYEWEQYELTNDPAIPHDRTHLQTGRPILADFLDEQEYWLTLYLKPRVLTGPYGWSMKTNQAGKLTMYPPAA